MKVQIGSLVKHIEWEVIGVATRMGGSIASEKWLIHFTDKCYVRQWCSGCELEVICK